MSRRLVVVLFMDLVGWTRMAEQIDPEPLQVLLEQYYEHCCAAVEEHGGEVEKFIGDAVMAVFGAARSQEDDALRAVRAAFRIRADIRALRDPSGTAPPLEIHCGIAAGEALVTRSRRAGMRVVGDVVNLAARLQSASAAGEILVNETVAHLAGPQLAMAPVAPLTLKGKVEPVAALRVTGPVAADRVGDGPHMVDRVSERALLRAAYDWVVRARRSRLVAVLGPLGIGKTRLVRETVAELGTGADAPTVVFGNCPGYGSNDNHAVLVQLLDALAQPASDLLRANGHVAAVLASLRDGSLSRRSSTRPGPGVEEVSWVAREMLAVATAARPLVVVWDGLESAGHSLLRLIGELAESLADRPLLMICAARPELAERDVPWIRGLRDRDVIELGGLDHADSAELTASLAHTDDVEVRPHALDLVDRVGVYSAGNPLFIRLVVESAAQGRPLAAVPPTITAVVGAMIDRLPPSAKRLLGAASVIGPTFTMAQLDLLGEPTVSIDGLVDRQLVRATGPAGEYCFVQQPVHEVAYARLDKQQRLAWHRSLAAHDVNPALHLEAAVRLQRDLRPQDPELGELARAAAGALVSDGTAALRQRDVTAAIGLLDRALELMPGGPAAIRYSDALMLSGDTRRAVDVVAEIERRSTDDRVRLPCSVQRHLLAVRLGRVTEVAVEQLRADLEANRADRLAWCRFEQLRMLLHLRRGQFVAAEQAACAALEHARADGDVYEEDRLLAALCEVRQWAPTPIAQRLAGCAELEERFALDRFLLVPVLTAKARCLALSGDDSGARTALAQAGAAVEQLGLTMGRLLVDQAAGLVGSLAGAHAEAERHYRRAATGLERAGHMQSALAMRVQAARECARQDRARVAASEIAALVQRRDEMDVHGRILCLASAVRLAAGGHGAGTDTTPGDLLSLLADTDDPCLRGEVYLDLAEAQRLRGNHDDATVMAGAAVDSFATVGATQPLRRVRAWT